MKARHKRAAFIIAGLIALAIAAMLVLKAFRSNLVFFYTPTQVVKGEAPQNTSFRIGGLVEQGSLRRTKNSLDIHFAVTDTINRVEVIYSGILPDLFKEDKGVVAQGKLDNNGLFHADQVLAKHDENYMPPEAAEALKQAAEINQKTSKSLVMPEAKL
ncbi:MAG: cytochrome c maturation protein CcmE [Methylotenera sp.]|nr:cytochrome c maturation protein CcmE [Methylotenera sp.]MDP1755701.1 cytochrome c maturation protein CcmE [Methylotenera sp.]MDP1960094.1 cytochrome c maturation protein CcmE [Methylotenera sp.]MDP3207429.1 cytochrome c maturation protein CcmE [Methylotenera sp.]MDP3303269.1 cytochrome c maturation protein CcmE [Methylotenera sp.]